MATQEKPFAIEYYYKTKWGYADEFIHLFKKNHYPVLKKQMELGRILEIKAAKPKFHATEDGRWDYRITIVWKNVSVIDDGFSDDSIKRQLYPDQETFRREEQQRFEILSAHWDLPVVDIDLEK
jgi:L-lysine 2,3-aminomutase